MWPFSRSWPYWPVISHRVLRRVLPGLAVSAVGDGMAVVAVSWLALQLAPVGQRGTWVAVAVAAYSLPSAAGTFVFGRLMRGRGGAQLAGWNAILRAGALGAIPLAYIVGALHMWLYVALLATSSLLESWGSAGRYTLVAELLAPEHHLPANAVLSTIADFAIVVGPALASILISLSGPVLVIAVDAASFAVLAATYRFALPANDRPNSPKARPSGAAGIGVIGHDSRLLGLLALSFGFFFLFGPVYVALPVHVAEDLHASATVLAAYYTAFAVGSVIGGLGTGYLRRWSLPHTVIGIVLGFGAAMLPLGLGAPTGVALVSFAIAGMIWAPYMSTSMALFQRSVATANLPPVLAAAGAATVLAVPFGTALGGPLVAALGAREVLFLSATGTLALGVIAAGLITRRPTRQRPNPALPSCR